MMYIIHHREPRIIRRGWRIPSRLAGSDRARKISRADRNSETVGVLRREASSGTAMSILRSPQLVRSSLCYAKYLTLARNTGSIVSMTRGCESFPGGARDNDRMKPQLESLEPE